MTLSMPVASRVRTAGTLRESRMASQMGMGPQKSRS